MWWTGMTIMILGELCNFAAYAFTEAIIVVRLFFGTLFFPKLNSLLQDTHGRTLCRDILTAFPLLPGRETLTLRLDRVAAVPTWFLHPRAERAAGAKCEHHCRLSQVVRDAMVPHIRGRGYRRCSVSRVVGCPTVREEEHVAL